VGVRSGARQLKEKDVDGEGKGVKGGTPRKKEKQTVPVKAIPVKVLKISRGAPLG